MFSFHSKYSVYRELKRAPQKLSFCFKCQDTGTVRGASCCFVKNVPVFLPVFLYAVTMLIFQVKRIISSEKWFTYVVTFLF